MNYLTVRKAKARKRVVGKNRKSMSNDIDIHQLDPQRQVLFVLNNSDKPCSVPEIKEKLIAYGVSPDTREIASLLNSIRDRRRKFLKDGLVYKDTNGYQIMQKGIEYLKSTVVIVDPAQEGMSTHQTISQIFSGLFGEIKLCDPYFDDKAFSLLENHLDQPKMKSIRIIYSKNRIDSTKNYKIGKYLIELKKKKEIHDRFIIDDNHLYFLGTSLNNIGSKLSFIFNLSIYRNKFDSVFQSYWSSS